ncbi:MAG: aspartyl/asparaginyl beta-hydroxylase domain-containing protein [Proteobacteria bacterium]|nr:aspartyl/asparaginyl beta-hydroxylase domain-containing protein [Pseudomonadota bacterium]
MEPLTAFKWLLVAIAVGSAIALHFRGRVRHKPVKQLTDHSTFVAPYSMLMYGFSGVPATPYLDLARFPELEKITSRWTEIRDEAMRLYEAGQVRASTGKNDLGFDSFFKYGWKRFYLKWYDEPLQSARELCPRTVEILQSVPSVHGAMFALLPPGGKLGVHRDPYAGSMRYHLGLSTPKAPGCRIIVDGEPYEWKDGEAVMFDETYIHWAENRTDTPRMILFADVERPLTNPLVRGINRWVSQHLIKASASPNVEGERVGAFNQVFRFFDRIDGARRRFKNWNKPLYRLTKWALLAAIVAAIVLA